MKKRWKIVLAVLVIAILVIVLVVFLNRPKPILSSDSNYNLSQIADGTYTGNCNNGIIKANVEVDVKDHTIVGIRITDHQNGLGSPAEAIIVDIITYQSVEVDAISGATLSSKTILKAVESALLGE